MARFNRKDQISLEKLLEMESGYVLNFSNRKFEIFVSDSVNREIYDKKYSKYGESKAKRLRCFWDIENNYRVKKLLNDLIDRKVEIEEAKNEWKSTWEEEGAIDFELIEKCRKIVDSIDDGDTIDTLKELEECNINDSSIELLMKSIKDNIENQEPELALDRLHTYAVKYIRNLCEKYGISYDRNKPLHSCYGEYIKYLDKNNLIESEMTKKILKYSISIFDAFNFVRNNQSYAHDNEILNYHESKLIFRSVSSIIVFIESLERIRANDKIEKPVEFEFTF